MQIIDYQDSSDAFCLLGLEGVDANGLIELSKKKRAIFIVDWQPSGEIPTNLTHHPNVHYFFFETPLQEKIIAKKIAWHAVMLSMKIFAQAGWEPLAQEIEESHHTVHLLMSEVADFGKKAFINARTNWQNHGPFRSWALLRNQLKNVPAIICGAGPSLENAMEFLPKLYSHALILAAGTAGSILSDNHIAAHMTMMLDAETPIASIAQQSFVEVPICLQSRLNPDCVTISHGEKILAPESGPLPWERFWTNDEENVSFGWTVGNFATQIAIEMGCNPIIWTGMDLCYRDHQKYAGKTRAYQDAAFIEINGRKTQRDWLLASRFLEELSRKNPHIRFVNTALEGLPLAHPIVTKPFEEIECTLSQEWDLAGCLHQMIQCAPTMDKKWAQKEIQWKESHGRCQTLLSHLTDDDFNQVESEIVYQFYLEPLWQIWRHIFEREAKGQNLDWHRSLFFQEVLRDVQP